MVRGGARLAMQCGCNGAAQGSHCHRVVICDHVRQQLQIKPEKAAGPSPDPMAEPPPEAYGLNLEAVASY